MINVFVGTLSLLLYTSSALEPLKSQPHIIFIYADDLGWNDGSMHGSPSIPTPNIDAIGMNGIALHNYYGEWLCTPSRACLLTGKYAIRLGLQHLVIKGGEASGLPLSEITLAQRLKSLGYSTHIIGKWHLGYQTSAYTPTYRGFDTFLGYLNGAVDYYDYTHVTPTFIPNVPTFFGRDLYDGTKLTEGYRGKYATHAFADRAVDIITNHNVSKPLFLYLPHFAVHVANPEQRLQAPAEFISKFKYIADRGRRTFAGMVSALDDAVGRTFEALNKKDMLKNSIIMFVSDNGGEIDPQWGGKSSNFPLRGKKETLWEGGIRVVSFMWSPLFNLHEPRISKQLMHVTDWLPTLYRAAGGDPSNLGDIDGFDMWDILINDEPSPRLNLLHNIDSVYGLSAYRMGDFKVVNGTAHRDWNSWYGPTGVEDLGTEPLLEKWVYKDGSIVRDILHQNGYWIVHNPDNWYEAMTIHCEQPPPDIALTCDPLKKPCLFNIQSDPCEYHDLADHYPGLVEHMMEKVYDYAKAAVAPQSSPGDLRADPLCHNFSYVPWLDPEHFTDCTYAS